MAWFYSARWPEIGPPYTVNFACVGLPSAGKSPAISAVAEPLAALAADLNDDIDERMRAYRTAFQEAKERRAAWEADVKKAVKNGYPAPPEPLGAREPGEPGKPRKRRILSTDPRLRLPAT